MLRTPLLSLIAALALACALPACGDDDEPATSGTTQEQTETGTSDSTPAPSSEDVDAAVEQCKQSVQDQPQLSDDAKSEIEALCDEAKDGDAEDVKAASRKVCERMVEETVPEGSARDQALETCKTATE
jgi:hypothetical protein